MPKVIFAAEFSFERSALETHTWPKGWAGEITDEEYAAAKKARALGEIVPPPAEATVAAAIAPALADKVELKPIPPIDVPAVLEAAHKVATQIAEAEARKRQEERERRAQAEAAAAPTVESSDAASSVASSDAD